MLGAKGEAKPPRDKTQTPRLDACGLKIAERLGLDVARIGGGRHKCFCLADGTLSVVFCFFNAIHRFTAELQPDVVPHFPQEAINPLEWLGDKIQRGGETMFLKECRRVVSKTPHSLERRLAQEKERLHF